MTIRRNFGRYRQSREVQRASVGLDVLEAPGWRLFVDWCERNPHDRFRPAQMGVKTITQTGIDRAARATARDGVHGSDQAGQPFRRLPHVSAADPLHKRALSTACPGKV